MTQSLTIQVWHDLICPICPIGRVKLNQGIELFAQKARVEVLYRSYRLKPGVAPYTVYSYLKQQYSKDADVGAILAPVERMGAAAGLTYRMANTWAGDTLDAHRLVHLAHSEGLQARAVERIQRAHFTEEMNIFDKEALVWLGGQIGLDRNAVAWMLSGDQYTEEVEEDENAARQLAVSRIPHFLVDGQIETSGGQPPERFLSILEGAWDAAVGVCALSANRMYMSRSMSYCSV